MLWRNVLGPKIKLLYTRATLSKFTACYILLALVNCLVGISLQSMTYVDNHNAAELINTIIGEAKVATGLTVLQNDRLEICTGVPGQRGTQCFPLSSVVGNFTTLADLTEMKKFNVVPGSALSQETSWGARPNADVSAIFDPAGKLQNVTIVDPTGVFAPSTLQPECVASLAWLEAILHDAKREDMVTGFFHMWLLSLSLVTIFTESIPHMGAVFVFHVLATAWAGFRTSSTVRFHASYTTHVVERSCEGMDLLGSWWDMRMQHAVPIVIVNTIVLLAMGYLSYRLFHVYNRQHMVRVGASNEITRIYKMVLVLSVLLQVAGFITLAATSLWIGKLEDCLGEGDARHIALYYAAFISTAVLQFPWLTLGWISVRREKRIMFGIHVFIGVILVVIQSVMFSSPLYMFVFSQWSFFGSLTVASYILVIATSVVAIFCRLNFGRGLAHYLHVQKALQDVDFTPTNFSDDPENLLHGQIPRFSVMYGEKATITPLGNSSLSLDPTKSKGLLEKPTRKPLTVSFLDIAPTPQSQSDSPLTAIHESPIRAGISPIVPPGLTRPAPTVQTSVPRVSMMLPASATGRAKVGSRVTVGRTSPIMGRGLTRKISMGLPANPRPSPKTSFSSDRF